MGFPELLFAQRVDDEMIDATTKNEKMNLRTGNTRKTDCTEYPGASYFGG